MPTALPRVNVAFDRVTYEALEEISKTEQDSLSHIVSKLVKYALELAEDLALVEQAEKRLSDFRRDDALTTENLLRWNKGRKKPR